MEQKHRKRKWKVPKITLDTLTIIVYLSLIFCACIIVWGMLQAQNGIDTSAIVDSSLGVFGRELGICGLLTIFKRWVEMQDRRAEESKARAKERREAEQRKDEKNGKNNHYDSESVDG